MNKIEKKDIFDLFVKTYNIKESDYYIITKVVDELYDLSKENVVPLTDLETFVFRKRYGIDNNGGPIKKQLLARKYQIDDNLVNKLMGVIISKLAFRINIIEKTEKIDKMSSIDTNDKKNLQEISVYSFQVSDFIKSKLVRNLIFSLKDLMQLSKRELKNVFNGKNYNELINYINSLGIKFIDDLSINEKKEIISISSSEKINNSSVFFIDGLNNLSNKFFKDYDINDIRSLIININQLPDINRISVSNSIINLGLNDLYTVNKKSR